MIDDKVSGFIKSYLGKEIYQRARNIFDHNIKILSTKDYPIEIRAILFEKGIPYHILIDGGKKKVFHECPSFLTHDSNHGCLNIYVIKLLLSVNQELALKFLGDLDTYTFSSDDGFAEVKSTNFALLSQNYYNCKLYIDALHFLNEAISYSPEKKELVINYLKCAIDNGLYLEFFNFLGTYFKSYPTFFHEDYNAYLNEGVTQFFKSIPMLPLFNLLEIMRSINNSIDIKELNLIKLKVLKEIEQSLNSANFNQRYFSHYYLKMLYNKKFITSTQFKSLFDNSEFERFKQNFLKVVLDKFDSIYSLKQFDIIMQHLDLFQIINENLKEKYVKFKLEINQRENEFLLRKFAFFKLLLKRNKIIGSKVEYKKFMNKYIITHDIDNYKNPFYIDYLLPRVGFFGENKDLIKARDIGFNFYIFNRLFQINWNDLSDVSYFKKRYWGDLFNYKINSKQGLPLLRYGLDYSYDAGLSFPNVDEIVIIEWDLAEKPYYDSIVDAFETNMIIPNPENPLFYDLKPFDLSFCFKNPIRFESKNVKIIDVIAKCSFKDAIYNISRGMSFIEGFYPLSLLLKVLKKEKSPFDAIEFLEKSPKKNLVPHFYQFIFEFKEFIFNYVLKEDIYLFGNIHKLSDTNTETIISLLDLTTILSGIRLPYSEIISVLLEPNIKRDELRIKIINAIHEYIKKVLASNEIGSTIIFDLNKMRNTQFSKYSEEIIKIRKNEFQSAIIYKSKEKGDTLYDLTNIYRTYYGNQIARILKIMGKLNIKQEIFNKIETIVQQLGLTMNIIDVIEKGF